MSDLLLWLPLVLVALIAVGLILWLCDMPDPPGPTSYT
jgi:hypothetical protein